LKRRRILGLGLGLTGASMLGGFATPSQAEQKLTPSQMRGPFYPRRFPLDKDFDLTRVAGSAGTAFGEILTVSGRVTDVDGRALEGVAIEIWQVNGHGRYHHEGDDSTKPIDPNFQGYGIVATDAQGRYQFRTVKPIAYPGRAPHIHFALTPRTGSPLSTQMYLAGAKENAGDFLLRGVSDKTQRDSLIVAFEKTGDQLSGTFDIVLPAS
jgi:protocatechuate 3,4-dioxygenase, beta subunit